MTLPCIYSIIRLSYNTATRVYYQPWLTGSGNSSSFTVQQPLLPLLLLQLLITSRFTSDIELAFELSQYLSYLTFAGASSSAALTLTLNDDLSPSSHHCDLACSFHRNCAMLIVPWCCAWLHVTCYTCYVFWLHVTCCRCILLNFNGHKIHEYARVFVIPLCASRMRTVQHICCCDVFLLSACNSLIRLRLLCLSSYYM